MKTILLIISYILFLLPKGYLNDTKRRYLRMKMYNPEKASDYNFTNSFLFEPKLGIDNLPVSINLISFILSLPIIFFISDINSYALIIIHLINYFVAINYLAFFLIKPMRIYSRIELISFSKSLVLIGFLFLFISLIP